MNEYNLEDFVQVIYLKNQLITLPTEELLEIYSEPGTFRAFLDIFSLMTNIDSGFMLFSSLLVEKVRDVIHHNRFNYKDREIIQAINGIIGYLNSISTYSESFKNQLKNSYLAYHEDCRLMEFKNTQVFINAMAYDAITYHALNEDLMELVNLDTMFLSSVNYLMATAPEIFDDLKVRELLLEKLNQLEKREGFFKNKAIRRYAKDTKNNYQKIKVKGE